MHFEDGQGDAGSMQWKISPPKTPQLQNLLVGKADDKLSANADCLQFLCTYVNVCDGNISHESPFLLFTIFAVKHYRVLSSPRVLSLNSILCLLSDFIF